MSQDFTIQRLGYQGDGIAEGPFGPVFVPFSLPGETVSGDLDGDRMIGAKVLAPSKDRVKAPCPHFKSCGGCALQHAADEFLAEWKTDIVKTALAAHGVLAEFRLIATSPPAARRRATLTGRRTKKGALVGFHMRGSDTIFAIPSCTLLHPKILAGMPAFEELTKLGATRKGEISLAVTVSESGLDIDVRDAKPADGPLLATLAQLCGQFDLARLSWNGEVVAGLKPCVQKFGPISVVPPPGAFLQATMEGQTALISAVTEAVGPSKKIADLFAGCGTFALPLAQKAEVAAYESDPASMKALDAAWRVAKGLKTVTTHTRDLYRRPLLLDELQKLDAVVIDPPRAGAKAQCQVLATSPVKRVAFVSCNPVTFARDALILIEGGYSLHWVQVVDQFRWSPHVELVAFFSR